MSKPGTFDEFAYRVLETYHMDKEEFWNAVKIGKGKARPAEM